MYNYTPNPLIVRKAVSIWRGALLVPKYDNGASDFPNMMAQHMASTIPSNAGEPGVMDAFCESLAEVLMNKYRWDGHEIVRDDKKGMFFDHLHVDYHPDGPLRMAASKAGLQVEFPWKTHMFLSQDYLSWQNGYRDESRYYYPLNAECTRWLVTRLHGSDIAYILAAINSGIELGMHVEEDATPIEPANAAS